MTGARGGSGSNGFAVLEFFLVLAGVVLLVFAIREGAALLDTWRSVNTRETLRNVDIAVYSYHLKYRALPGDDRRAPDRWGTPAPATDAGGRPGDGRLDGPPLPADDVIHETDLFWQHLRLAGILASRPDATPALLRRPPTDGWGRPLAVTGTALGLPSAVCGRLLANGARAVDANTDDGHPHTGTWRWTRGRIAGPPRCPPDQPTDPGPTATVWLCTAVGPPRGDGGNRGCDGWISRAR